MSISSRHPLRLSSHPVPLAQHASTSKPTALVRLPSLVVSASRQATRLQLSQHLASRLARSHATHGRHQALRGLALAQTTERSSLRLVLARVRAHQLARLVVTWVEHTRTQPSQLSAVLRQQTSQRPSPTRPTQLTPTQQRESSSETPRATFPLEQSLPT